LYSSDRSNSIQVSKEFMGSGNSYQLTDNEGNSHTFDIYGITGDDNACEIFEFMEQNTNVEWSGTKVGTNESQDNFISTSQESDNTFGLGFLLKNGYTIRGDSHNHFKSEAASGNDKNTAEAVHKKFPNAELYIYYKGAYFEYCQFGNLNAGVTVTP